MFNSNNIIEICGGIASGKTTLCGLLSKFDLVGIYESFQLNPFWKDFYSNPTKYALETEITFSLQHYHQIKKQLESKQRKTAVCDYSCFLDIAYAEIGLHGSQLAAFKTVYDEIRKELPSPVLIIYLQCDPEIEFARIRARGREVEKNITLKFLRSLNEAVAEQINKVKVHVPILTIDSGQNNFVDDENVKNNMLQLVADALHQAK